MTVLFVNHEVILILAINLLFVFLFKQRMSIGIFPNWSSSIWFISLSEVQDAFDQLTERILQLQKQYLFALRG